MCDVVLVGVVNCVVDCVKDVEMFFQFVVGMGSFVVLKVVVECFVWYEFYSKEVLFVFCLVGVVNCCNVWMYEMVKVFDFVFEELKVNFVDYWIVVIDFESDLLMWCFLFCFEDCIYVVFIEFLEDVVVGNVCLFGCMLWFVVWSCECFIGVGECVVVVGYGLKLQFS